MFFELLTHFLINVQSDDSYFPFIGIPLTSRQRVWMHTSGCQKASEQNPNFYLNLLKTEYNSEFIEVIKMDIPRTFPDNIYFDIHKNELFNVLSAFAQQNQEIGYCQGLNYIAGLMLIVTKNEETSFWLLKHLVENVTCDYHSKTMFGLQRDIYVISELVKLQEPIINEKVLELGLPWAVILTKWLICCFAEVLPVETVLRIWDVMFAEGYKIIFRTALAMIYLLKDEILKTNDITDLAELFRNMSQNPVFIDCHSFINFMFKIKITRRQIENLRGTYRKIK
jgi:TBC1 domain family member 6